MAAEQTGVRVFGEKCTINYAKTLAFFDARVSIAEQNALTATMYQDPDLALRRDYAEKQRALPVIALRSEDRVLDIGCGSGRWAQVIVPAVRAYLGIDFSSGLLEIARTRMPSGVFQRMTIAAVNPAALLVPPPYTLFVCSGILTYLNDSDILRLFSSVAHIAAPASRFYVREPIAKAQRLTLDGYWSEELDASYSAVYRTRAEYLELFSGLNGFHIRYEDEPFPQELQNRTETEQRFFLLERVAA
jgi:SAM-dependent methyltransferase